MHLVQDREQMLKKRQLKITIDAQKLSIDLLFNHKSMKCPKTAMLVDLDDALWSQTH